MSYFVLNAGASPRIEGIFKVELVEKSDEPKVGCVSIFLSCCTSMRQ